MCTHHRTTVMLLWQTSNSYQLTLTDTRIHEYIACIHTHTRSRIPWCAIKIESLDLSHERTHSNRNDIYPSLFLFVNSMRKFVHIKHSICWFHKLFERIHTECVYNPFLLCSLSILFLHSSLSLSIACSPSLCLYKYSFIYTEYSGCSTALQFFRSIKFFFCFFFFSAIDFCVSTSNSGWRRWQQHITKLPAYFVLREKSTIKINERETGWNATSLSPFLSFCHL